MSDFQAVYLPVGTGTFHMGIAGEKLDLSRAALSAIDPDLVMPDELLLSPEAIAAVLEGRRPDAVIFQNITFANAAAISEVLRACDCPILLWALNEPRVPGGRLCLNSLTGIFSASNTITQVRGTAPAYIVGDPDEPAVQDALRAFLAAARVKKALSGMNIACIGQTPQGFGFGQAGDSWLLRVFGVRPISAEARSLIGNAAKLTEEDLAPWLERSAARMVAFDAVPKENRLNHARLYKAYSDYIRDNNIGALASRCWPDFFTEFGTPVCAVLSLLNDDGVAAACETDLPGALTMKIGMLLSGGPVFFGDPSARDAAADTITYWHCGMAACSLAREDTGAVTGVHPNRKIGPAMDFACRPMPGVTVFRVDIDPNGQPVFFISEGSAPDVPKSFIGTSLTVHPDCGADALIEACVANGLAPHYAVIPGRFAAALKSLAGMLGVRVITA